MKTVFTCIILLIFLYPSFGQAWKEKFLDKNVNVLELEREFMEYWSQFDLENVGGEYKEYSRMLHRMKKRIDNNGFLQESMPLGELVNLHERNKALMRQQQNMIEPWVLLGPQKSPAYSHLMTSQGVGRVTSIAWHPDNENRLLAGGETGGIWISDNLGDNWYTNSSWLFPDLGIQHIVYSPSDGNIVYAGTGGGSLFSFGVLKSTDGGDTWELTNFTPSNYSHLSISDIIVHPQDANNVIVSTDYGTFQSFNGGLNWSLITELSFRHMQYSPQNVERIYAVSKKNDIDAGFYYSEINSSIWNKTFDFESKWGNSRIGVTVADPDLVYLWERNKEGSQWIDKFYKSNNEGNNFTYLSTIPPHVLGPAWGGGSIAVDHWNPNIIFLAHTEIGKSTDGGLTWDDIPPVVHVDHWDAHFLDNENRDLFIATDGGVWSTEDYGDTWSAHNNGLEVTQFYRISNTESNPYITLGGTQDMGTMRFDKGWTFVGGGDGMDNAIDPNDADTYYFSLQTGYFKYSYDGGQTVNNLISPSITGVKGQWVTPLILDKQNPNILYAGYDRVWKSSDKGQNWTDFNHPSLCSSTYSCITHLDISKSNPKVLYAVGDGNIFRTTDAGETWIKRNTTNVYANWLEIDPKNENRLWMTKQGDIYESTDGGVTWVDIKGDLPYNMEFTCIIYDEDTNDHLYVGTIAQGLYFKDASMTNWIPYDLELPKVEISDIEILENYKIIRVGTYGRGIWQTYTMDHRFCDDTLNISNVIDDGLHQAMLKVQSDGIALPGSTIKFSATEDIELNSDFEVKQSAKFEAIIDSCLSLVPPILLDGYVCDRAIEITKTGNINSPGPDSGNGSYRKNLHAVWYYFTAPFDCEVYINSCGEKTQLTLWKGSCQGANPELDFILESSHFSDDCGFEDGSKVEYVFVKAEETILLEWDNRYSFLPFQFFFQFSGQAILHHIQVETPISTDTIYLGEDFMVQWNSENSNSNVKIELYKGNVIKNVLIDDTSDSGTITLNCPDNVNEGSDYRIKISSIANPTVYDFSEYFTIDNSCPNNLQISNPSDANANQEADYTISTNQEVLNTSTTAYHAGDEILMTDGFVAKIGSNFRAYLEGCTGNFQSFSDEESTESKPSNE